jgi:hypothetical protein
MKSMKKTGWLAAGLVMAMSQAQGQNSKRQEATTSVNPANITLTIRPHICIAPRGESSCISRIELSWKSDRLTDVCLHTGLEDAPLNCWNQSRSGEYDHRVTILNDLDYWLAALGSAQVVVKSTVKYAALRPHRKHKRRRSVLPWSIQSL